MKKYECVDCGEFFNRENMMEYDGELVCFDCYEEILKRERDLWFNDWDMAEHGDN